MYSVHQHLDLIRIDPWRHTMTKVEHVAGTGAEIFQHLSHRRTDSVR